MVEHWREERNSKGFWHSFEFPDGTRIDGVCDIPGLKNRIAQFPIPSGLAGKRVLEIGAPGMDGSVSRWNAAAPK